MRCPGIASALSQPPSLLTALLCRALECICNHINLPYRVWDRKGTNLREVRGEGMRVLDNDGELERSCCGLSTILSKVSMACPRQPLHVLRSGRLTLAHAFYTLKSTWIG